MGSFSRLLQQLRAIRFSPRREQAGHAASVRPIAEAMSATLWSRRLVAFSTAGALIVGQAGQGASDGQEPLLADGGLAG